MSGMPTRKKSSRCGCCLAVGLGVPLLALFGVYLVFTFNNRPPDIVIPTPAPLAVNAYDDFVAAGKLALAQRDQFPNSLPDPAPVHHSLPYLSKATREAVPIQAVLRRGLGKPYQAPIRRTIASLVGAGGFPTFSTFRQTARVLSGMSEYYDTSGQIQRAADARLDAVEMGVMIPHGGPLIDGLVGVACEAIGLAGFERLIPRMSRDELAHVARRLDRIDAKRTPYADIVLEESNVNAALMRESLRDPGMHRLSLDYFQSLRAMLGTTDEKVTFREVTQIAAFTLANKTAMLRENLAYHGKLADEAHKPFTGKSAVPVPNNLLAQMEGGIYSPGRRKFVGMEAVTAVLRVEIALYRYRADHGRFPDRMDALAPAYLRTVPDDPYGGRAGVPLCYRLLDGGKSFLLYSVGDNMVDDGGTPERVVGSEGPGDIVAGKLWPNHPIQP